MLAATFGPLERTTVRESMTQNGDTHSTINKHAQRIIYVF